MTQSTFADFFSMSGHDPDLISPIAIDYGLPFSVVAESAAANVLVHDDPRAHANVLNPMPNLSLSDVPFDVVDLLGALQRQPNSTRDRRIKRLVRQVQVQDCNSRTCASLARKLEELMLDWDWSQDVRVDLAQMVARLTDIAVYMEWTDRCNGFCADIADRLLWDPRIIAGGFARLGVLSADDPRILLQETAMKPFGSVHVGVAVLELLGEADNIIGKLGSLAGSPYGREALSARFSAAMTKAMDGCLLDSPDGLALLIEAARCAEGVGMNMHLTGVGKDETRDRFLALAAYVLHEYSRIAFDLHHGRGVKGRKARLPTPIQSFNKGGAPGRWLH